MTASVYTSTGQEIPLAHTSRPVRVGVLVTGPIVPNWIAHTVQQLGASGFLELFVLVQEGEFATWWTGQAFGSRRCALLRWLCRLDHALFKCVHDAFGAADIRKTAGPAVRVNVSSAFRENVDGVISDLLWLMEAQVDLVIELGAGRLPEHISWRPRYGIWTYPSSQYVFGDMLRKKTVIQPGILVRGISETQLIGSHVHMLNLRSIYRNENCIAWQAPDLLTKELRAIHAQGPRSQHCVTPSSGPLPPATDQPLSNIKVALLVARHLPMRVASHIAQRCKKEQWFVAYRRRAGSALPGRDMEGFQVLQPPPDRFYADPFVIDHDHQGYIFFEEYRYSRGRGEISCVAVNDGVCGLPTVVLTRDYHLSYPFLFEYGGDIFLMPETREKRRIEVYRATQFPTQWTPYHILMDNIPAVDSTLVRHGGEWWLFVWTVEDWDWNGKLLLFHSDHPFGRWIPHRKNPISTDPRNGRPAGAPFGFNGELIRPAQDCSSRYGHAVILNQVAELSESEYCETPIETIGPQWLPANLGTHTFNQSSTLQVLDGRLAVSRLPWPSRTHCAPGPRLHVHMGGCASGDSTKIPSQ